MFPEPKCSPFEFLGTLRLFREEKHFRHFFPKNGFDVSDIFGAVEFDEFLHIQQSCFFRPFSGADSVQLLGIFGTVEENTLTL